ncbi:MAG TPA: hypothetical protein VHD31_03355 [Candidatus Paceibacterota bacterium]|nr:hypothetical protein [Candidatus Paceibacterota bacterium]
MRRLLLGLFADDSLTEPPHFCSVGPYDPKERHPEERAAFNAVHGGKKLPVFYQPDERHDDHAPKQQQQQGEMGSTGQGDAGLGDLPDDSRSFDRPRQVMDGGFVPDL